MKNLKVKSILFSLLAMMAVAVFMTSCNKEEITEELTQDTFLIDFPKVNNDVLKFRDVKHFKTVYEELNKLYDEDDQKFNEVMEGLNRNSVYNKLANDVFVKPKNRYQPFLTDPVMMSLVNENFEFQVSEVLHTCITNEVILTSDINDTETRSEIRAIYKGQISSDQIPTKAYPINDNSFDALMGPWGNTNYDINKVVVNTFEKGGDCAIEGETIWDWETNLGSTEAISFRAAAYRSWGRTYEEAKVYSYTFEGGEWNPSKGEISATVWASRRNGECQWNNEENEQKWCDNCRNKRARVNKWGTWRHFTGDVDTQYRKIIPLPSGSEETILPFHIIVF